MNIHLNNMLKLISDQTLPPDFDKDVSMKINFYPKSKNKIKKFSSQFIDTNIIIDVITKCNVYIKSEMKEMKTKGLICSNFKGNLTVKIVNDQHHDITLGTSSYLGYLLFVPFVDNNNNNHHNLQQE